MTVPAAGFVIVPLNTRHAEPELRYALEDSGTRVLITDRDPDGLRRGEPRCCTYNSLILGVFEYGLVYVEGFAIRDNSVIPHAWNVDDQRRVIDLTLCESEAKEREYFGVALSLDFVLKTLDERDGETGVLDNCHQEFPLFRDDQLLADALHPAFSSAR